MDNEVKTVAIVATALVTFFAIVFGAISHSERLSTETARIAIEKGCSVYPQGIVVCPKTQE